MARPGQQVYLFGRVRIDRPVQRAKGVVEDSSGKRGKRRAADSLDAAAKNVKDPRKRAAAEKAATKFRKKHVK